MMRNRTAMAPLAHRTIDRTICMNIFMHICHIFLSRDPAQCVGQFSSRTSPRNPLCEAVADLLLSCLSLTEDPRGIDATFGYMHEGCRRMNKPETPLSFSEDNPSQELRSPSWPYWEFKDREGHRTPHLVAPHSVWFGKREKDVVHWSILLLSR